MVRKKNPYSWRYCTKCKLDGKKPTDCKIKGYDGKMIAFDRPYINIWFHRDCFDKIGGYDGVNKIMQEAIEYGIIKVKK